MNLDLLPPLTPALTLAVNPNIPPNIPLTPPLSMLFHKNPPYRTPNNPFQGLIPNGLREKHKKALKDALNSVRGPSFLTWWNPTALMVQV